MAKQYLKWYENHKAAFLAGKFDVVDLEGLITPSSFLKMLDEGKTFKFMWLHFSENLPITSQLLMSGELFKHISKPAEANLKKQFKNYETDLRFIIDPQTNA